MTAIALPLIRQSERGDFKSCPKRWDWRWNQGLIPATPRQDARWFGTLWHLLWATVYTPPGKDGFVRSISEPVQIHELWDKLTKNAYTTVSGVAYFGEDDEREFNDAQALGHIMIDGQLKEWNLDPTWEVMMPEQRFSMRIPFTADQRVRFGTDDVEVKNPVDFYYAFPAGKFIAKLVGTYDLPIRDHSDVGTPKPKLVDWKTTAKRTNDKQLNKDDQTGTYLLTATFALRSLGFITEKEACEYMIFSFARKAKPPEETKLVDKFGRVRNKPQKNHYMLAINGKSGGLLVTEKDTLAAMSKIADGMNLTVYGEVSKNQGSPLFWRDVVRRNRANKANQLVRIAEEAELMALMRAGDLPIVKSPGDHCNWCDYADLCDIDEDGGDTESFIKDVFKYEDPYMDHRAGARNSKEAVK